MQIIVTFVTHYLHEIQEVSYAVTVTLQLCRWKVGEFTLGKWCHQIAKLADSEIKCELEGDLKIKTLHAAFIFFRIHFYHHKLLR